MAASALTLNAGPALRTLVTLTQPDGTPIEATFRGDEFGSFYVDQFGQQLRRDSVGYWVPMTAREVSEAEEHRLSLRRQHALDMQQPVTEAYATRALGSASKLTLGEHHLLTILVQFTDLEFTTGTNERFEEMLNGEDYTFQGATGSAQRYFLDNSQERFKPIFDVVGPVTLSHDYAYYGGNSSKSSSDLRAREAMNEAVKLAISEGLITDLSPYDGDGDGYVELVYLFYAGHSESDGAGDDFIWPHNWSFTTPITLNGVRIQNYSCSSELRGSKNSTYMCGIGSCVHEFGHGLGLPDFYNTGSNTGCYGMDRWSVMDQGNYCNSARTPCNYTAYERHSLGWLDYDTLPTMGDVVLPNIATSNKAYVYYNPSNPDEAFIFENHQSAGWDAYYDYSGATKLHGMFITHVDYEQSLWKLNHVNIDPTHQHYTMVPADGELVPYDGVNSNETYTSFLRQMRGDIWPGRTKATEFSRSTAAPAVFFTGDSASFQISNIAEDSVGNITFHIEPYGYVATPNESDSIESAIDFVTADASSRYVDLYDLAGRRIYSGVERTELNALPLRQGYYLLHDGKATRKIYVSK
jgi:M6 family metalloprotease-like protein